MAIHVLLNGIPRAVEGVDPNTTVLEWLRAERLCGTKEGCAEGDCGACTVLVGRPEGDALRWDPVNACIQLLPALDGAALVTVEGLAGPGGALHPVQQAMVDAHGSQCGFCTPGFVMSLAALRRRKAAPTREDALLALAGNLCRCTGYRPILDAALAPAAAPDPLAAIEPPHLAPRDGLAYEAAGKRFDAPRTLAELFAILDRHPGATLLAGGTDVGLWITKQHRDLDHVVWLGAIDALKRIVRTATHLELGAGVTWAQALPEIAPLYPGFGELILRFASEQIRAVATIGGNIANASPIGDGPPPLIALGAALALASAAGTREIALEDFFKSYRRTDLRPGEIVASVRVPLPRPDLLFATWKVSKRFDQDISAVCGAFALTLDRGTVAAARIAYGGMAAVPARAPRAEAALAGNPWSLASVEAAMAALDRDFAPIADLRAGSAYRRLVARNLLLRLWHQSAGTAPARVAAYG